MDFLYSVCAPSVVSEVIDGEAIIMDMRSGIYYSADGVAAMLWEMAAAGASLRQMQDWAEAAFADKAPAEAVRAFFDECVDHGLMSVEAGAPLEALALPAADFSYAIPTLSIHDDMQDLIMLDPIHDVGEAGWPARKAEPPQPESSAERAP